MLIRKPHVAGSFYPSKPSELREFCETYLGAVSDSSQTQARAVILPHAGYVYSGKTACHVLSEIKIPESVLLIGPNHWGVGAHFAICSQGEWETPLGKVPIDSALAAEFIESCPSLRRDDQAHSKEHSLEVIVPFLQVKNPKFKMVPMIVGTLYLEKAADVAEEMAGVLEAHPETLIVISTDMNHYEEDMVTRKKDRYALDAILALDEEALVEVAQKHQITMCGLIPVYMLLAMKESLGITKARLIDYTTSAQASGDKSRVVGYAGFIFE